jgi:hypothetical protein
VKIPAGIGIIVVVWIQPGIGIMYHILYSLDIISIGVIGLCYHQSGGLKLKFGIFLIISCFLIVIIIAFIVLVIIIIDSILAVKFRGRMLTNRPE